MNLKVRNLNIEVLLKSYQRINMYKNKQGRAASTSSLESRILSKDILKGNTLERSKWGLNGSRIRWRNTINFTWNLSLSKSYPMKWTTYFLPRSTLYIQKCFSVFEAKNPNSRQSFFHSMIAFKYLKSFDHPT